jgi:hypothetical protein
MEQVHEHCKKFLAMHKEIFEDAEILAQAIKERWGNVDPAALLERAELNSLHKARDNLYRNPKTNPWVDTTIQGDFFNDAPVKVPEILMINGKPTRYTEASLLDGLEWWLARYESKRSEKQALSDAAQFREEEEKQAAVQVRRHRELIEKAIASGLDPSKVLYAQAKTQED